MTGQIVSIVITMSKSQDLLSSTGEITRRREARKGLIHFDVALPTCQDVRIRLNSNQPFVYIKCACTLFKMAMMENEVMKSS
jgi:hypothetical protein